MREIPPPKGHPKAGGRQKGTPNKYPKALKDMILTALSESGGVNYLQRQAQDNPAAFLTLIGKTLPMTVAGDITAPVHIKITREIAE